MGVPDLAPFSPAKNRAQELRSQATRAERLLWRYLCRSQVDGFKFSRQMPLGPYFADFLCRSVGLIVELDGYSHDFTQDEDAERTRYLIDHGYVVKRFTNAELYESVEGVVEEIRQRLHSIQTPTPDPSRKREGG